MLRVGLTGGIGSGKSTAARRFAELGAVLVDSDVLAREVVAPGTTGLGEVVAAFGTGVLAPDGSLDRPALAAVVFGDPEARARLNAIVHPRVRGTHRGAGGGRGRRRDRGAGRPACSSRPARPRRSRWSWWCTPTRRCGCGGSSRRGAWRRRTPGPGSPHRPPTTRAAPPRTSSSTTAARPRRCAPPSTTLWHGRLVPFEANLRARRPVLGAVRKAGRGGPAVGRGRCPARLPGRAARPAGERDVAHVGPTAVPGLPAVDVARPPGRRRSGGGSTRCGPGSTRPASPGSTAGRRAGEWWHGGADPGRPVRVVLRPAGSPAWRAALLWRDWLRADECGPARSTARPARASSSTDVHPSGGMGRIVGVDAVVGRARRDPNDP